jgi:hypothetical protein
MDANFLKDGISKIMTPSNHRIMDGGHDFFSTIEKAQEIGAKNNWSDLETFQNWAQAYFTDLSSPAGMPMFGKFTDEIYNFLRSLNIDEQTARDFVTLNGQEAIEAVLGGAISSVAIFFAWKAQDKEVFSKTIASLFLSSVVSLNPVVLVIATIGLAFGYQKLVCREAVARGALAAGAGLLMSSYLGLIPAIIGSVYISKKMGKDFKPIEYSAQLFELIKTKEFRDKCEEMFREYSEEIGKKAA